MIQYKGIDIDVREYRCQSVDDKKESLEDYLLLRPKRATAHPSPARIPMNGAGALCLLLSGVQPEKKTTHSKQHSFFCG